MSNLSQEAERIRKEYLRRGSQIPVDYYSLTRAVNLFFHQGQERALRNEMQRAGLFPLHDQKILDLGCGTGDWLAVFELLGANRHNLAGIELDEVPAKSAAARLTGADIRIGDACTLPWPAASFDIVFQRTVFTSILELEMQHCVASEMMRVLRQNGAILWIDFALNNPRNANVKGIGIPQIRSLFPNCKVVSKRITLLPPLARFIVPRCWLLGEMLQNIKIFNTHRLCVIQRV